MKAASNLEALEKKQVQVRNSFLSSQFKYTQLELDILFMLISIYVKDEQVYSFPLSQMANITGRQHRPQDILKEVQSLMSRVYTINMEKSKDPNENDSMENDEDMQPWVCYNLFSRISYNRGIITAKLTDEAMFVFSYTKSEFAYLQLKSALLLRNKYAKRLYMLLSQWKAIGGKRYSIEELRRILTPPNNTPDAEENISYKNNHDFIELIKRAVYDINKITELHVETKSLKQIRSVVTIDFSINLSSGTQKLPLDQDAIDFNNSAEKNEIIGLCRRYGFLIDQALEIWDKGCRKPDFDKIIGDVNKTIKNEPGKIKDITAYLVTCFANAGYLTIDKSQKSLEKTKRNQKKRQAIQERARIITMIRQSLSGGADIAAFKVMMDNYGITLDDVRL